MKLTFPRSWNRDSDLKTFLPLRLKHPWDIANLVEEIKHRQYIGEEIYNYTLLDVHFKVSYRGFRYMRHICKCFMAFVKRHGRPVEKWAVVEIKGTSAGTEVLGGFSLMAVFRKG